VYHGNGTRELASLDPNRTAWAFDTFEGMPAADYGGAEDASDPPGKWKPNTSNPAEMFEGIPNVRIVKGRFADTLPTVPDGTKFILVHIDCDWYLSHKQVLNWLADNHLADRAILLFDDPGLPGAKRAIDEWCSDFAEHVTRVQDTRIDWGTARKPRLPSVQATLALAKTIRSLSSFSRTVAVTITCLRYSGFSCVVMSRSCRNTWEVSSPITW
jgi:hypothetical protein